MAHCEDRWWRTDPKGRRVQTSRYGTGLRWRARYIDPDGAERSRSFTRKTDAEGFLTEVEHSKRRGTYTDPDLGKITLGKYAAQWLAVQAHDPVTRDGTESRLRVHVYPVLGRRTLAELAARPSVIQAWVSGLPLAPSSARGVFTHLNSVMGAAARDGLITRNPCAGIKLPKTVKRRVDPWTPDQAAAVRAGLPARYQAIVDAGAGLGLRQSELFGLAVEEIDFLRRVVHVRQQVKMIRGRLYFAAPKGQKERHIPLASQTGLALSAHLAAFPAVAVTLPWHEPGTRRHGKDHTAGLLFTTQAGRALNRASWNGHAWRPALRGAGLPANERVNGCHMLRHVFASTLISRGVDVRTVAAFMGHSDGGALVLRTYSHLMPDAEDRARRALEEALSDTGVASSDTNGVSSES